MIPCSSPTLRKIALSLVAAICLASPVSASLDAGLEAYYTFDIDTGHDSSGNQLHLELVGDVQFASGLVGRALFQDGNNSRYAARPISDPALNFGNGDFTIQAWVNYSDTSGEQILLEKFTGATGPGWTIGKLSTNRFGFANDVGSTPVLLSGVLTISLDTWHHLVVRRTQGFYEMFFNNVLVASASSPHGSTSSAPLLIARRNDTDGRDFSLKGKIDEIAIWSRSLSDAEIDFLYNDGVGQPIIEVELIFFDRFEALEP